MCIHCSTVFSSTSPICLWYGQETSCTSSSIDRKEVTSFSSKGHGEDASSATEKCSEEEFKLQQIPAMPDYVPSQILERLGYITSYSHDTKCPNWVSLHLTSGHTDGPYPRNGVPYYSNDGIVKGIGNVTPRNL